MVRAPPARAGLPVGPEIIHQGLESKKGRRPSQSDGPRPACIRTVARVLSK